MITGGIETHTPLNIKGCEVELVSNLKLLGVYITDDLTWHENTSDLVKKAEKFLYFLQTLKKAQLFSKILTNFYF